MSFTSPPNLVHAESYPAPGTRRFSRRSLIPLSTSALFGLCHDCRAFDSQVPSACLGKRFGPLSWGHKCITIGICISIPLRLPLNSNHVFSLTTFQSQSAILYPRNSTPTTFCTESTAAMAPTTLYPKPSLGQKLDLLPALGSLVFATVAALATSFRRGPNDEPSLYLHVVYAAVRKLVVRLSAPQLQ